MFPQIHVHMGPQKLAKFRNRGFANVINEESQGETIYDFGGPAWWFERECSPRGSCTEHMFPCWWHSLQKFRRCNLAGEHMSLDWSLRFYSFSPLPVQSLYYMFVVKCVISQIHVPAAIPATVSLL